MCYLECYDSTWTFFHVGNPVPYRINTLKDSQRLQKQNDQEHRSNELNHSNV